jgi:hypothetical protein
VLVKFSIDEELVVNGLSYFYLVSFLLVPRAAPDVPVYMVISSNI